VSYTLRVILIPRIDADMKTMTVPTLIASIALIALTTITLTTMSLPARADDRPDHYRGEAADSLEQALANLAEYNARIADILAQEEVTLTDLARIHELTYTVENALERIDDEYDALEDQLEELHLATEAADIERAQQLGRTYLENASRFPTETP